jgi:hypothetical protein
MRRNKSGLPQYCSWNLDRENGRRRVRFRKRRFQTYIYGTPWSAEFMRHYAAALEGVTAQTKNIGESRTLAGTVDALVVAYLDCSEASTSPFKTLKAETKRTRRNILESFRRKHGEKPLCRTERNGERSTIRASGAATSSTSVGSTSTATF